MSQRSVHTEASNDDIIKSKLSVSSIGLPRNVLNRFASSIVGPIPGSDKTFSQVTIIKQGYMTKQGGGRKNWKKRWFSLQKGGGEVPRLFYYKNLNENIRGQEPLNCIYLDGVKINRTHKDRFEVDCAARTFFFRTDTEEDCDEWVKVLLSEISAVEKANSVNKKPVPQMNETQTIECEGYLVKQGQKIKTKKRRWFVLRGKKLLYYKDDSKTSPLGLIDLEMCLRVSKGAYDGKSYAFELLTMGRNFPLCAETKEEMENWVNVISERVDKSKSLLSYSEAQAKVDRSIFSSEESSEDDDEGSSGGILGGIISAGRSFRKPQNKAKQPAPPFESIPVEEPLPSILPTQTNPTAASAAFTARPVLDDDSVFELDLESMKSNLGHDYDKINNLFEDLLGSPTETNPPDLPMGDQQKFAQSTSSSTPIPAPAPAVPDPNEILRLEAEAAFDNIMESLNELDLINDSPSRAQPQTQPQTQTQPPRPQSQAQPNQTTKSSKVTSVYINAALPPPITSVQTNPPPANTNPQPPPPLSQPQPQTPTQSQSQSQPQSPVPTSGVRKVSSNSEGFIVKLPTINIRGLTIEELVKILVPPNEVVNQVATCNELVDRLQADPNVRNQLKQLGAFKILVELSCADEAPLRFYALRCLSALSTTDEARTELCDLRCVPVIMQRLNGQVTEDTRVKKQALRVLINLSFTDNPRVQHEIKINQGLVILNQLLIQGSEDTKGLCLQVLMNASANEANAIELVGLKLIQNLKTIILEGFHVYQRYCCFILANLSCHDIAKEECDECGCLEVLLGLISSSSKEVQYEVLRVFTNLSNSEKTKVRLREIGGVGPLVTMLGRATVDRSGANSVETQKILLHSLWTLTNMATNTDNQIEMTNKGALPFITAALLHTNKDIQHQAVWGIANLSTNPVCRGKFDEIITTALLDLLKTGTDDVKGQAVKAIANLALDESYRHELGKQGGCAELLQIVKSKQEEYRLHDYALVALLNLSLEAYCRDAVRNCNGLGTILMVIKDPTAKEHNLVNGLKLFTNLAFTDENRSAFLTMKAVPLIQSLRGSPLPAVSQQAAKAAQMLGLAL